MRRNPAGTPAGPDISPATRKIPLQLGNRPSRINALLLDPHTLLDQRGNHILKVCRQWIEGQLLQELDVSLRQGAGVTFVFCNHLGRDTKRLYGGVQRASQMQENGQAAPIKIAPVKERRLVASEFTNERSEE